MRAILTASTLSDGDGHDFWETYFGQPDLENALILDPFVGGGTSVVEASRCGASVLAFDIDPVAAGITRFELGAARHAALSEQAKQAVEAVAERIRPFHRAPGENGAARDVLHHFWVEVVACMRCGEDVPAHPHHRLAYNTAMGIQWVFCRDCGAVHEMPLARREIRCECGARTPVAGGPLRGGRLTCPHCRAVQELTAAEQASNGPPRWRLFAQEILEPAGNGFDRRFRAVTAEDIALYDSAAAALAGRLNPVVPERAIPEKGRSDGRPLIHGVHRYRDLFNTRQLLHLSLLGEEIAAMEEGPDRRILAMAFSEHLATNCMYAAYAFGYRRVSPMFSIHGYRHITRPVELNPWLTVGRGTFPNALRKIARGAAFARNPSDLNPGGGRTASNQPVGPLDGRVTERPADVLSGGSKAAVAVRSSTDLYDLPDATVDMVLTDPPYFDNVGYSELSDFYLAWHQTLGIAPPPYDDPSVPGPIESNMAAASRSDGAFEAYARDLARVLSECRRVLKPNGLCVFTYHHRSARAWQALAEALLLAGLRCTAAVPMRGEGQGGLHSFEGTIKWDAVLTCRPGTPRHGEPALCAASISEARDTARAWNKRLACAPRIGFRRPDALNLYRALLVAAATRSQGRTDGPLIDALRPNVLPWEEGNGN